MKSPIKNLKALQLILSDMDLVILYDILEDNRIEAASVLKNLLDIKGFYFTWRNCLIILDTCHDEYHKSK